MKASAAAAASPKHLQEFAWFVCCSLTCQSLNLRSLPVQLVAARPKAMQ